MSTLDEFKGYLPEQVAEITGLFSATELRRLCAHGEIQHHRGAKGRIVFYRDDVRALLRKYRQAPARKTLEAVPTPAIEEPAISPFRTTSRSRAAHKETSRRSA